jgi:hypothetical protein
MKVGWLKIGVYPGMYPTGETSTIDIHRIKRKYVLFPQAGGGMLPGTSIMTINDRTCIRADFAMRLIRDKRVDAAGYVTCLYEFHLSDWHLDRLHQQAVAEAI